MSVLVKNVVMSYNGKRFFPSVTPNALKMWGEAEFGSFSGVLNFSYLKRRTLVACDQTTYAYLRANPSSSTTRLNSSTPAPAPTSDTDAPTPTRIQDNSDEDSDDNSGGGDGGKPFKLILRSSMTDHDITVTVKATTKCGAIVTAFLQKAGLAERYGKSKAPRKSVGGAKGKKAKGNKAEEEKNPQLCIDGDKIANDTEIGEMDLEDGDLVEVVGL